MRVHSLATLLSIPFLIVGGWMLYQMLLTDDEFNTVWILVPVLFATTIFIFKPQIDRWWWSNYHPVLPAKMKDWLITYSDYYNQLNEEDKQRFELIMSKFLLTKEFYIVGKEVQNVPYDIKAIVSHEAIKLMMTFGEGLFNRIEKIVLYKHAFPTPINQVLHTVEVHEEDGVLIFSLEHLIPGLIDSQHYYNIAMHGFFEALISFKPNIVELDVSDISWDSLTIISGKELAFIEKTIGLPTVDKFTVVVNHYLTYNKEFKRELPHVSQVLDQYFSKS